MSHIKYKILNQVKPDFQAIETALKENLGVHLDLVSEVAGHILFSGGKRLRPLLMCLSARICGYSGGREAFFSTIFEYLHAATLLHDDLVDGGRLRRGKPAAHFVYGNEIAVLTGDFLLARSLSIASETQNTEVIRVIAGITENMAQGEIHQLTQKENLKLKEQEYMEIIRRKTAVLIEGACKTGALISKSGDSAVNALAEYGFNLGMAFQMADDLLDYISDTKSLGKAVGADLREGKLTLPVIHALESASEQDRILMEKIILNKDFSEYEFNMLKNMLNKYKGIEYTKNKAKEHTICAKQMLSIFKDSAAKETLIDIADYALARKS
ncbi:Polyprenyl synthetase [Desulfonema limicola]|uniref:Polyprenyl synthetase n=1 Tax=Desulfonema limicola TaxID=45656 RepID=A0A975B3C4_9BACT|nr:polyprenyl synthetase family protein [Desulfonema limicola]QTA78033.1 Polyprenyl synthetase [Desulfonema limicola]